MVTLDKPYNHPFTFKGKSTDTKPIAKWGDLAIENGDYYLEMDTGNVFFYDKGAESGDPWVEPS